MSGRTITGHAGRLLPTSSERNQETFVARVYATYRRLPADCEDTPHALGTMIPLKTVATAQGCEIET